MIVQFPNANGLFQQNNIRCHTSKMYINGLRNMMKSARCLLRLQTPQISIRWRIIEMCWTTMSNPCRAHLTTYKLIHNIRKVDGHIAVVMAVCPMWLFCMVYYKDRFFFTMSGIFPLNGVNLFQDNNPHVHKPSSMKFSKVGVEDLEWPLLTWTSLRKNWTPSALQGAPQTSVPELTKVFLAEWLEILKGNLQNLLQGFPRRVEVII